MHFSSRRRAARSTAALALILGGGLVPTLGTTSPAEAVAYDACGATLAKSDGGVWACTFVENFTGSSLDASRWSAVDTRYSGFRVGDACFDENRNLSVRHGVLRMSTTSSRRTFVCDSPVGDFSTKHLGSGIMTGAKFSQTYGRFEARIAFPKTTDPGLHSNFWMNPAKRVYGAWPLSGEIDIAEWYSGAAGHVLPALHYGGSTAADVGWWTCAVADASVLHTYGVEWTPTEMTFMVDGQVCWTNTWTDGLLAAPAPFDQEFTLAIVNGVGPAPGNPVTSATDFPAVTVVDYVKAWQ